MIRSVEGLRRDQAGILASYRQERAHAGQVAVLPRPGGSVATVSYGRVSAVVTSDPDDGPHLLVVRQEWSGMPPAVSDGSEPAICCYPPPNRSVGDYAVDAYVRMVPARGAMVAEILA